MLDRLPGRRVHSSRMTSSLNCFGRTLKLEAILAQIGRVAKDPAKSLAWLHLKDYRDYEFIVAEIQRFQSLSPEQQWEHWKAHPWDAMGGIETPAGGKIYFTRDSRIRFHQIGRAHV